MRIRYLHIHNRMTNYIFYECDIHGVVLRNVTRYISINIMKITR